MFPKEVLQMVLPEVAELEGVQQNPEWHPEGDVLTHTMLVVQHVAKTPVLIMAALLHDVGKKATTTFEDGRWRAHGHDKVSANMTRVIMKRMKFSKLETETVVWLITKHMTMHNFMDLKTSKKLSLMRDGRFADLLALHRADILGRDTNDGAHYHEVMAEVSRLAIAIKDEPEKVVTGKDLIVAGLTPGRHFGPALEAANNAFHDNEVDIQGAKDLAVRLATPGEEHV